MERFDLVGPERQRERSFRGRVLDRAPDELLQSIVAAAARIADAPIATVSLLLNNLQFFRAHIGLPADLLDTQATDRCVSFCQVVAAQRATLCVEDALNDERVPQTLVRTHGVRAYLGVPVAIGGDLVGTLCVIDLRPRPFTAHQVSALEVLARDATRRLDELANDGQGELGELAMIAEVKDEAVRNIVAELDGGVVMARVSAVEMESRLRALERQVRSDRDGHVSEVLADTGRVAAELSEALLALEGATRRAVRIVQASEAQGQRDGGITLEQALDAACSIAGGIHVRMTRSNVTHTLERLPTIAALSVAFSAILRAGWQPSAVLEVITTESSDAFEIRISCGGESATVAASALSRLGRTSTAWSVGNELVIRILRAG